LIAVFTLVLFVIAAAGLGYAATIVVKVAENSDPLRDSGPIIEGVAIALVPFSIGTIALGFTTVSLSIGYAQSRQLNALQAMTRTVEAHGQRP
jgi:hypothetical protein